MGRNREPVHGGENRVRFLGEKPEFVASSSNQSCFSLKNCLSVGKRIK